MTTFTNIYRGSQPVRSALICAQHHLFPFQTATVFPTPNVGPQVLSLASRTVHKQTVTQHGRWSRAMINFDNVHVGVPSFYGRCGYALTVSLSHPVRVTNVLTGLITTINGFGETLLLDRTHALSLAVIQ